MEGETVIVPSPCSVTSCRERLQWNPSGVQPNQSPFTSLPYWPSSGVRLSGLSFRKPFMSKRKRGTAKLPCRVWKWVRRRLLAGALACFGRNAHHGRLGGRRGRSVLGPDGFRFHGGRKSAAICGIGRGRRRFYTAAPVEIGFGVFHGIFLGDGVVFHGS